jgi:type I restriction enzyme S subunit
MVGVLKFGTNMPTQTKTTWRKVKLGEIGKIITGKTPSTKEPKNFDGPFPFITIPDLKDQRFIVKTERTISEIGARKMKNLKLPANAVAMSCLATVGETGIITKESFTNQQINSVICDPRQVDYKFLYYAFRRLKRRLQKYDGSVYTNISKTKFADLEIEIPEDVSIQKRIADILSAFDDKIELNNKISRTLEEMAQAIFKEWFVKNAKFKNKNAKLEEIAKIIKGKKPQIIFNKSRSGDTEYLLIESFITNNRFFTNDDKVPQSEDGDTIIVMDGASSGRIFRGRKGAVGSTLAVIKPKQGISCEFLFLLLKHAEPQLMDNLTGSAIPHLDKYFLKTYPISVPTLEIMEKFTYIVKSMLQKVVEIENENQKLAALRDLLLPKLMSGEIKV